MSETSERVSILEVKIESIEKTLDQLDINQKQHLGITLQIKERLDKQNGAIPHMQEDMKGIVESNEKILSRVNKDAIRNASTSTKIKILWSLFALGIGSLLTHLIHHLLLK